ncbi:isochorismatase family protein [Paenibacillus sp. 481]|uniref:isochorismatase family protein n=1 Tax=Paenibacillus sp. 481 TaxID=2835869 RepID=UPI001E53A65C|nr:isochorismatase family protein [Paenibacillus sp. 481]UHA72728.1 isochorismatase family protein [Paenibacillus sp. 481]
MKQALIVVDMQEIFFNEPQYFLHDHNQLLENVNLLINHARQQHIPVIFIQHTDPNEQGALFEGKDNWKLHRNLRMSDSDTIIKKTKWDAFYNTPLLDYLTHNRIEQLIFAGAQTEFCLDTTIRAAYSLGYQHNILYKHTHSTLNSACLEATAIIQHHEHIWNHRFVTLRPLEQL